MCINAPPPSGRARPPGAAAYVYNLHILCARVKFLVDIIARRKVRVEFRLSQVHFRVPVVPLFLHQNTIIYPGKCGPFGNLGGGGVRTHPSHPPCVRACISQTGRCLKRYCNGQIDRNSTTMEITFHTFDTYISKHIITVSNESACTLVHVTTNIQRAAKFLYCDPRLG